MFGRKSRAQAPIVVKRYGRSGLTFRRTAQRNFEEDMPKMVAAGYSVGSVTTEWRGIIVAVYRQPGA